MTVMRKSESLFGAPAGVYTGVFLGVTPMRDNGQPRLGKDGKPMQPGIEWTFRITGGPYDGRVVSRVTAAEPTSKNSCGKLFDGVACRVVPPGEDVDIDQYVGRPYQIVVAPKADNKNQ